MEDAFIQFPNSYQQKTTSQESGTYDFKTSHFITKLKVVFCWHEVVICMKTLAKKSTLSFKLKVVLCIKLNDFPESGTNNRL